MGSRSARIFERGDAGRLIGVAACWCSRIDVGHDEGAVLAGIEIGIQHAIFPAELELEARSLLNLEGGTAEMGGQLGRRKAVEPRRMALHRSSLHRLHGRRSLLRPGGATGENEG